MSIPSRISMNMSEESVAAGESVPKPTRMPDLRNVGSGAKPMPSWRIAARIHRNGHVMLFELRDVVFVNVHAMRSKHIVAIESVPVERIVYRRNAVGSHMGRSVSASPPVSMPRTDRGVEPRMM